MSASLGVFWFKHSSSQANKPSSILGFSRATTGRQPASLINNSQAFIMPSALSSFLGRVQQVLAASLWYHASFQRPSEQLLKQLSQQLRKLMASAQQASHSDDAVALAQGCFRAVPICPLLALGLHCSQGSSPAPCPCPRGVWGLCMCRHRSKLCKQM